MLNIFFIADESSNGLVYFSQTMKSTIYDILNNLTLTLKKIVYFVMLFSHSFCQSQSIITTKLDSINFEADDLVGTDGFGNYFFLKNNVLVKRNENGIQQYQNISLGKIKKVDLINPLKVLVFYEEFNAIVLLDNQMNEIQKIEFSKNETPIIVSATGMSGQNQLWIYNSIDQQIGLYDMATNTYKSLGVPIKENLLFYQTDFNYFHWIDTNNQWFSCSIFGRTTTNGLLKNQTGLQLLDNNAIVYFKANALYWLDRNTHKEYKIEIVENSFKNFYYKNQILSIFTTQGITNYKITLP